MVDVAANYAEILRCISEAADKCGRNPTEIKLLAAAKSQSVESVRAAITAGCSLIGENYVQEAQEKKAGVQQTAEWHMIGHLQRNKVQEAVKIFDVIESLDSAALARELDKEGKKRQRKIRALVEINLGSEPSKSGIAEEKVPELFQIVGALTHLTVEGLMTVPPFKENPEEVRPYFRSLRDLQMEL